MLSSISPSFFSNCQPISLPSHPSRHCLCSSILLGIPPFTLHHSLTPSILSSIALPLIHFLPLSPFHPYAHERLLHFITLSIRARPSLHSFFHPFLALFLPPWLPYLPTSSCSIPRHPPLPLSPSTLPSTLPIPTKIYTKTCWNLYKHEKKKGKEIKMEGVEVSSE